MSHRHWRDLTAAALAWTDVARRPQGRVRGRKPLWALAIAVNFIGPIAYLCWGRAKEDT